MNHAIEFDHVTKVYRLGGSSGSLRHMLATLASRAFRRDSEDTSELIALNDITLCIDKGESIGFIGPNGSGKTTTLKLISNITRANSGSVRVHGRVSALIELGAGFHPDLTGRENIYFNAAILGMRQHEVQKRFDEIVDFSGLERFLDTPVKRYSSGMYCRLGFAVAAHVNPDILLIDEVLAVGDRSFQVKCFKRMSDLRVEGTTIVFVTHSLGYLQRLCRRVVFLYRGNVIDDGPVRQAIESYQNHNAYAETDKLSGKKIGFDDESIKNGNGNDTTPVSIQKVYFSSKSENKITEVITGSSLQVHIIYSAHQKIANANFEVWFYGLDGTEYASFATNWDSMDQLEIFGSGEICLQIDQLCIMPGTYFVNVAISRHNGLEKFDAHYEKHRLVVLSGPTNYGLVYQPHCWVLD